MDSPPSTDPATSALSSDPAAASPSTSGLRNRFGAAFWERHTSPQDIDTHVFVYPVLICVTYHQDHRLLLIAVAFIATNPVLFPRPVRIDNYLSRIIFAERAWLDAGRGTTGLDYPSVLSLLNIPVTLYAIVSAIWHRPIGALLGTLGVMVLKLWWVDAVAKETGVMGRDPDADSAE